jgi:hypothetical protein
MAEPSNWKSSRESCREILEGLIPSGRKSVTLTPRASAIAYSVVTEGAALLRSSRERNPGVQPHFSATSSRVSSRLERSCLIVFPTVLIVVATKIILATFQLWVNTQNTLVFINRLGNLSISLGQAEPGPFKGLGALIMPRRTIYCRTESVGAGRTKCRTLVSVQKRARQTSTSLHCQLGLSQPPLLSSRPEPQYAQVVDSNRIPNTGRGFERGG